jgi:hypothetical protein
VTCASNACRGSVTCPAGCEVSRQCASTPPCVPTCS